MTTPDDTPCPCCGDAPVRVTAAGDTLACQVCGPAEFAGLPGDADRPQPPPVVVPPTQQTALVARLAVESRRLRARVAARDQRVRQLARELRDARRELAARDHSPRVLLAIGDTLGIPTEALARGVVTDLAAVAREAAALPALMESAVTSARRLTNLWQRLQMAGEQLLVADPQQQPRKAV